MTSATHDGCNTIAILVFTGFCSQLFRIACSSAFRTPCWKQTLYQNPKLSMLSLAILVTKAPSNRGVVHGFVVRCGLWKYYGGSGGTKGMIVNGICSNLEYAISVPICYRPCYYSNMAPPNLPAYSHSMMLGHEAPVSQRERTKPLRDWILKHRSHPYPSKEDKLALAMMTRMRLDQVSMWFANTRRQIRKVGMKAWSGGIYATPLPHRVGNGG